MKPEHLFIILVQPQGPINIGSVCRAMMNFGFTQLRLVKPTRHYKSLLAKKMALTSFPVLENALIFDDLSQALADIHVAFGTTRRFGKYRKKFFPPALAAQKIHEDYQEQSCALVLGPEDTGLETKDLDLCQHFITIPTHDGYPSMNLSHALSILLYEISLKSDAQIPYTGPLPEKQATGGEIEGMFAHMKKTLLDIDFLDRQNPDHLLRTFRRMFGNTGLTSRDIKILRGMMSRIDWTEEQRRKYLNVHEK
ncbi:MAG: RNA methyltransferase [Proteobacteria bacterium]|nr:RNA methyltransferase [Pseudomonadota bacterium]MBU1387359.1 RNA methyltransferase [Pseudomonadota bacterium]MBU1541644.1 RNA methyltransferase [Pseudomonadota bacterium]MBU2430384.1 RNA methyltransferase [Pseudomonadota bacterium]MBU2481030.1 RNA methyltransferase [Pseudomonadota bacterium]